MKKINNQYSITKEGKVFNTKTNKELRKSKTLDGYLTVGIKRKAKKLHRLLAEAFIDNPNNYPIINHIDGNKLNNNLDNLEWCNHSYNNQHAWDTGLRKIENEKRVSGTEHGRSNFDKYDIENIRKLNKFCSQKRIAELYNCHPSIIQRIVNNKTYS